MKLQLIDDGKVIGELELNNVQAKVLKVITEQGLLKQLFNALWYSCHCWFESYYNKALISKLRGQS